MANSKKTSIKKNTNSIRTNNRSNKNNIKRSNNNKKNNSKIDSNIKSDALVKKVSGDIKNKNMGGKSMDPKTKELRREILGIILVAIAAFLIFVINQSEKMGLLGKWTGIGLNILFGKGMYIFPFAILLLGILQLLNILLYSEKRQVISVLGLFICSLIFLSLLDGFNKEFDIFNKSLKEVFMLTFETNSLIKFGGGIFGNFIGYLLVNAFGKIGAYIILVTIGLVFLIIFTNQSIIGFFKLIFKILKYCWQKIFNFVFVIDENEKIDELDNSDDINKKNIKKDSYYTNKNEKNNRVSSVIGMEIDDTNIVGIKNKGIIQLKIDAVETEYANKPEDNSNWNDNCDNITVEEALKMNEQSDGSNQLKNKKNKNSSEKNIKKIESEIIIEENNEELHNITEYKLPSPNLLSISKIKNSTTDKDDLKKDAKKLIDTLQSFNIQCSVTQITKGPTITRYEIQPAPGIKVSKITSLQNDIALNLATSDIRMEAPIPGKSAIGIEVPNKEKSDVLFRGLVDSKDFKEINTKIPFALGKDIAGKNVIGSIEKMPHLLVAGATGSGKSVCINTLIMSILYKAKPDEVKLILVDPKVVELSVYNGIPHLLIPVVTDPRKASNALNWAVSEMTNRYKVFAQNSVRDIFSYNTKMIKEGKLEDKMPQIVIIIDELADLMQVAPGEVEECITRIAQLARACGIHLVIATQRPSVDVITGTIKANIPSRIAFAVSSFIDSRTILDSGGAEKLLGKGDMLYHPIGLPKPIRIQGTFISDDEIKAVVDYIKGQNIQQKINNINAEIEKTPALNEKVDDLLEKAIELVVNDGQASTSYLQRRFSIGYNRAARLIEALEERGIISGADGSKPRKVLISKDELEELNNTNE